MKNHEPVGCGGLPNMVKIFEDSSGALEAAPPMPPASPMVSQSIFAASVGNRRLSRRFACKEVVPR